MKFTLEINFGNDGMQTCDQLAEALNRISSGVFSGLDQEPVRDAAKVYDKNGNAVGKWAINE